MLITRRKTGRGACVAIPNSFELPKITHKPQISSKSSYLERIGWEGSKSKHTICQGCAVFGGGLRLEGDGVRGDRSRGRRAADVDEGLVC
ncbi:hypothetical protein M758_UG264400 [Ceratodon purpureus]|nr:hypothetical protein M758_UG264400 [Ceratodon purpureus]